MNENIITIYDKNNQKAFYKVLVMIKKKNIYIIYTDVCNNNINDNLYVIKIQSLEDNLIIPMDNNEIKMIELEYKNLMERNNTK